MKPAEVDQDHSSDDEEIPPPTLAEVRKALNTLTRFVDYKGNEDSVRRCMEFSGMVTSLTIEAKKQSKIETFFKPKP